MSPSANYLWTLAFLVKLSKLIVLLRRLPQDICNVILTYLHPMVIVKTFISYNHSDSIYYRSSLHSGI